MRMREESEQSWIQGWRKRSASVSACVSGQTERGPSKSRLNVLLSQLHLANEKHHYAATTATPLRVKTWGEAGYNSLKGTVLPFCSDVAERKFALAGTDDKPQAKKKVFKGHTVFWVDEKKTFRLVACI